MKEIVAKINQWASSRCNSFLRRTGGVIRSAFGQVSWKPPNWLSRGAGRWRNFSNARPKLAASWILGTFALACISAWGWHYYKNLPQPHHVTAWISPIPVTTLEKDLTFPVLRITFSESAAQLEDLKKKSLGDGVRLDPSLPGTWHWDDDRHLIFQPSQDWPADTKYRVIFARTFFPRHVVMEHLSHDVQTPPFDIAIKDLKLYQDPTNPSQRQLSATFELSHPIEPGELEHHARLAMLGQSQIFPADDAEPHFTITYGMHHRLAYVHSSNVVLPNKEDFVKLIVTKGTRTSLGGALTQNDVEEKLRIPSVATVFRIDSSEGIVARNKNGEPEQILVIETTTDISTKELASALDVRLLPKKTAPTADEESSGDKTADENATSDNGQATTQNADDEEGSDGDEDDSSKKEDEKWQSPTDVPDEILAQAKKIEFNALPSEKPQDHQHTFRIRVETAGELYVRVKKGIRAPGNYPLVEDYDSVLDVPTLPREVKIEGDGGLLALSGERKLSVRSRGLSAIEYEVARVATAQINHLVSQTEGRFQSPEFQAPYAFNQENISRIVLEHQPIAMENAWKANYSAFDFAQYLAKPSDGGSERGLFFLTARGWDPEKKKVIKEVRDGRFLLVTDIGIVTKRGADHSEDVFLLSIKNQKPIAGATVEILGKNGIPLQTSQTDSDGHCSFASVAKEAKERAPVAFVARLGDDVSFIPYAREDRILNFSRFDIEGVESVLPESLDAFVFTERGVYRPGDLIHAGLIVKRRDWAGNLKGLPVEVEVLDARDTKVQTKNLSLPETGFTELSYQTANESPTGLYTINVYLVRNSKRTTLLGSTTTQVKEFLPDRMKINAHLSKDTAKGWINPDDVRGMVNLANLYGTPATNRRVTAKIELIPSAFTFASFPGYVFYDPLREDKKEHQEQSVDLGEQKTDDNGETQFELQLTRFADATYSMRFVCEGFEAEGGRSVTTDASTLVSALPYVVGCKSDADLGYVEANSSRAVDLIALDPNLNKIAIENVTVNVIAQEYVSVLMKQDNGNYAFESVLKERVAKSEKVSVSADGLRYQLPTSEPGNFVVELRDDQNRRLTKTGFCVVGRGTVSRSLEKNAELEIKLSKTEYNGGDDVAISITAPYAGSGLITIERDKVYAYQWFQATTASSVQHIRVPENFEGSGYINVSFVRALDSKEIFVSPLSYGVAHFTANRQKRALNVQIDTAEKIKPGEPLHIRYKTDRPGQIVIFAVDQGILQVTDFKTPDPLGFFFRKCVLAVQTAQIVDQIVPEFSLLRSVSAFGGGGDVQKLNPFKRVTEKPVVYWSGVLQADATEREVVYDVPDFFDGTLRIMAVAVTTSATGSAQKDALVRGPFVITPSVPVLAAPGDEFEAGVTVANNVEGSGPDAEITLAAEASSQLSIVEGATQKLRVAEGKEQSTTVRIRVKDELGSAELKLKASVNGQETQRHATLSVRPAVPFMTEVRSGNFKNGSVDVPAQTSLYPEFRKLNATVAAVPLGLANGLDQYLQAFPHGCSEQVTSAAFCRLLLADEADFGLNRGEVNKQLDRTFGILKRRQNDQGLFGYWAPETGDHISFVSAYVMDFLSEAKRARFNPPQEMFASGLLGLQKIVRHDPDSLSDARTVAYAIYVLTREGVVTTNYILNLEDYLEKHHAGTWQNDLTGVYLAGALHGLHKDSDAEKLIGQYQAGDAKRPATDDFCQPLGSDSQYLCCLGAGFSGAAEKDFGRSIGKHPATDP